MTRCNTLMWYRFLLIFLLLSTPSFAGLPPTRILDEGTDQGVAFKFDCVGAGIACTQSGITGTLTVSGSGSATITGELDNSVLSTTVGTIDIWTGLSADINPAGELNVYMDDSYLFNNADDTTTGNLTALSFIATNGNFDAVGAIGITVGSGDVTSVISSTDGGSVTLDGSVTSSTGLFDAVGAIGITIGSSDVTALTVTTDSTGTAEVVLPTGSIGSTEILDNDLLEADLKAVDSASDEECLTYETTTGDFEWQACGSGSGDVTDVGDCTTGACFTGSSGTVLTATTGETLDLTDDAFISFIRNDAGPVTFKGEDDSSPATTIYDTTGAGAITVGSGDVTAITLTTDSTGDAEVVLPTGSISTGEILDATILFGDLSATPIVTAAETIAANDNDTTIPTSAAVKAYADSVGSGATAWSAIGDAASDGSIAFGGTSQDIDANTNDITAIGQDVLTLSMTNDAATDILTQRMLVLENLAGANGMETLLVLNNADADDVVTTGIEITSGAGAITTAINASDAEIATALSVGANDILGTTGLINYTNFDVDAAGAVTAASTITTSNGIYDATGAIGITVGSADVTAVTVTTDSTGTAEVVLPASSIGYDEIVDSYHETTLLPDKATFDDSVPPGLTVQESTGTGTSRRFTADFAPAADEIVYWTFIVPSDMSTGNWLLTVNWFTNDTGADEDAIWAAQISCTTEGDADSMAEDISGAAATGSENCNATEANRLIQTAITMSDIDSAAAGDNCTLIFRRDADDSIGDADNDGLSSDARLLGVRLQIPKT